MIVDFPVGTPGGPQPAVLVRDTTAGRDLYGRQADIPCVFPASCTKLMTLLLAWEYHGPDWETGTVTLTADDVAPPLPGMTISSAGFKAGDIVTWAGLAYGLVLPSGCDAALAIARVIGDELYAAAGNTGLQGVPRFVERMNERAAELGMATASYADPFGGSKTYGPDVTRNVLSARDLCTVGTACFAYPTPRAVAGTTTATVSVGGPNARSMTWDNCVQLVNGPTLAPAHAKDPSVIAAKSGQWASGSFLFDSMVALWTTPSGHEVMIVTLGSVGWYQTMLDQRGLYAMLFRDYPDLLAAGPPPQDPYWSSVRLLVGGGDPIVDESPVGRPVQTADITTDPVGLVGDSAGSLLVGTNAADVQVADAPDLAITGDFTAECWFAGQDLAGPGSVPGPNVEQLFFSKNATGRREFAMNYLNGQLTLFSSADGTNWATASFPIAAADRPVFFNGAPRHLAIVRSAGTWFLYVEGEKVAHLSTPGVFHGAEPLYVVRPGYCPIGAIDEYRVTYGVARYTGDVVGLTPWIFPRS